jgi:hypothetical protein
MGYSLVRKNSLNFSRLLTSKKTGKFKRKFSPLFLILFPRSKFPVAIFKPLQRLKKLIEKITFPMGGFLLSFSLQITDSPQITEIGADSI